MVEWKKLGEVCKVHTGSQLNRSDMLDNGLYPVVNGGRDYSGYTDKYNEDANTITISQGGESAGFVNWINVKFWAGAHCYVVEDTDSFDKRFLYHVLKNKEREIQISKQGAGIPGLTRDTLYKQVIAIPSLSEQQRIVTILDTFTSSIANLKQQIEERRKQYEYKRDRLLDLDGREGVEMKMLGEIMQIVRGASPRPIKNFITNSNDGVNWIKIGDVSPNDKYITQTAEKITKEGAEKSRHLHSGDFILSNSMSFGRPYILKIEGCIHDGWIAMSNFEEHVTSGYLYEMLNTNSVQQYWKMKANNGGAMTNLNSDIVKGTIIPLPTLSEQSRIVSILDTFEASIKNLEEQLALREKQYEYYRNKLLTFE